MVAIPISSLHQENLLVLTNFVNEAITISKALNFPATPSCIQPYLSQNGIAHYYA